MEEEFKKLLEALKNKNSEEINGLGCELFITNEGGCNWTNINKFEEFSGAKIVPLEKDSFGWLIGGIKFEGETYSYG